MPKKDAKHPPKKEEGTDEKDDNNGKDKSGKKGKKGPPPKPVVSTEKLYAALCFLVACERGTLLKQPEIRSRQRRARL